MSIETVERNLQIGICGESFTLPVRYSPKGSIWWILQDESQEPMYRGKEIEALADVLPEKIFFEGIDLELTPVPKYDKGEKKYLDESEPFEKTRRFWGQVTVEDVVLKVQFRLTVKKNGKWNFSARAHPEVKILGQDVKAAYEASSSSALKETIDELLSTSKTESEEDG